MALELKTDDDLSTITDADLVPDGDKDTTYQVRHITTEKHRLVVKAHTTKVPNKRTHQRDDVVDWDGVSDELLDYAIAGWTNVVAKGVPLDCTLAHKMRLDGPRKTALLEYAGMNEVAAAPARKAESFRPVEGVR
jgi:hypothetical protein